MEISLLQSILYHCRVLLHECMESASYVFSFRVVFFDLVTTGWIFDLILREHYVKIKIGRTLDSQSSFY